MGKWKFYTPDGVADILPDDCEKKRQIEQMLRDYFTVNGYREIETPGMEFYDVYSAGDGFAPAEEMFKLFDREGRILSLRYDGTIPAARVASTLLRDATLPLRLSYIGNMYRYNETGGGKQREFTQAGIELIGPETPQADAQVIAMAVRSALLPGICDLQLSLGNVEFFKGLMEEWTIDRESAQLLQVLIDTKETVALEELSDRLRLDENAKIILSKMITSCGTFDLLEEMGSLTSNIRAQNALDRLGEVLRILDDLGVLEYVSLDLGMLQSLNYYTGIIFKGFTYGIGFPLLSGGRYDNVAGAFGRELKATGFSIGINFIMTAMRRQNLFTQAHGTEWVLGYDLSVRKAAFEYAKARQQENVQMELDCMGYNKEELFRYADRKNIPNAVFIDSDGTVTVYEKEEKDVEHG
jgi:ATP phosphoribosyltransferase regulatory subunit